MTRTFTALADRMVGLVAPKATARAACSGYKEVLCYCSGPRMYKKLCRLNSNCTLGACNACLYVGLGC